MKILTHNLISLRHGNIWHRRASTRSVLWLHLIFMTKSVALLEASMSGAGVEYERLHWLVSDWSPLSPDTTWALFCLLASVTGIYGWWRQNHNLYLSCLIFSALILAVLSVGILASAGSAGVWMQWLMLALCIIIEISIAPAQRSVHGQAYTQLDRADWERAAGDAADHADDGLASR